MRSPGPCGNRSICNRSSRVRPSWVAPWQKAYLPKDCACPVALCCHQPTRIASSRHCCRQPAHADGSDRMTEGRGPQTTMEPTIAVVGRRRSGTSTSQRKLLASLTEQTGAHTPWAPPQIPPPPDWVDDVLRLRRD